MKEIYRNVNVITAHALYENGDSDTLVYYGDYTAKQLKNAVKKDSKKYDRELADLYIEKQEERKFTISIEAFCEASEKYMYEKENN